MTQHGALSGIKVLDLSRVLAGPWAAQTLGDLGAEVVKVEKPGAGDDTRSWGPPFLRSTHDGSPLDAAYYVCANRNKKSVAIDIATPQGQRLVRELAPNFDVLIENYKVGGLKKYGLDYDAIRQLHPRIVYCSITGFGQNGPYSHRAGYDFLIQGMGGMMSVTGRPDDEPGGGPMKVGVALTDILTGLYASTAILAALRARDVHGVGQHIDLSLLDVQIACLANQATNFLYSGEVPQRMGNAHPNAVPYQDFRTKDGFIILAIGNDSQFRRFCDAAGLGCLADDERFARNTARIGNRDALVALISRRVGEQTTKHWVDLLHDKAVPCGPIRNIKEVFEDEHVAARNVISRLEHPLAGRIPVVSNPIRLSETPVAHAGSPPTLGQHTESVLTDYLGLDGRRIQELRAQGVLG
ncbi:CoA transferase [Verticiella sediminum]|uniref:CoA transferase n=1 Tax=Verticiella sediminum TaxID=1247510 RepID=A0A556AV68_9BURK|nr:CaiB/BaiF CoA-transferase family protein [Verticiella sediminum]TSH96848.1 CoA transferase [Verticiella sediminum]